MGDYRFRGKLAVGWFRLLLYCEGEVYIVVLCVNVVFCGSALSELSRNFVILEKVLVREFVTICDNIPSIF